MYSALPLQTQQKYNTSDKILTINRTPHSKQLCTLSAETPKESLLSGACLENKFCKM